MMMRYVVLMKCGDCENVDANLPNLLTEVVPAFSGGLPWLRHSLLLRGFGGLPPWPLLCLPRFCLSALSLMAGWGGLAFALSIGA